MPPSQLAEAIASFKEALAGGKNAAVLLGNFAQQHPQAAQIHAAAQALALATNSKVGFLGEAANSVGGYLAGMPAGGNAASILKRDAFVLLNAEPELDMADPQAAMAAMRAARFVVALSAFRHRALEYAHVMLPIAPFTETAGTFVSTEGRVQSFHGTVKPLGEARPGWKVLRVLGELLGRAEVAFDAADQVRDACLAGRDVAKLLSNRTSVQAKAGGAAGGIQRIADVPIYWADALARRSPPLADVVLLAGSPR